MKTFSGNCQYSSSLENWFYKNVMKIPSNATTKKIIYFYQKLKLQQKFLEI